MGEGLFEGWEGLVELLEFSWGMYVLKDFKVCGGGFGGLVSVVVLMVGVGKLVIIKMELLVFKKCFDVGFFQLYFCVDNYLKVVSVFIIVLYIKQQGCVLYQLGFVVVVMDGYFVECDLEVREDGLFKELIEIYMLNFKNIKMIYLKMLGKDNLFMVFFFYFIVF